MNSIVSINDIIVESSAGSIAGYMPLNDMC